MVKMQISECNHKSIFCQICAIRNGAICADLDHDELHLLNTIGRRRRLTTGEQLLWEGGEAVLVANVIEGMFKLSRHTSEGKEQILGLAYPSDFLGRPFGQTMLYGVEALTDAYVCVFERGDFDRFAHDHPRLEHKLLENTLQELDRTRNWMLLLGRMTAEERLATFLLEMHDRLKIESYIGESKAKASPVVPIPLSRQQIADVLGLTIETVSRQFTKLRKEGIVDLPSRREVAILQRAELEDRTG